MILLTFKAVRGTTSEHTSKAPRTVVRQSGDISRFSIEKKRITAHHCTGSIKRAVLRLRARSGAFRAERFRANAIRISEKRAKEKRQNHRRFPSRFMIHCFSDLTYPRTAVTAAGVTPEIRDAAPNVSGRTLFRRMTTSFDRPPIFL